MQIIYIGIKNMIRKERSMEELLYGRELLDSELPQNVQEAIKEKPFKVEITDSFTKQAGKYYCKRCQTIFTPVSKEHCICGEACGYCRNCLKLGKVRRCSHFYHLKEPNDFPIPKKEVLHWKGTLSEQQEKASKDIVETIKKNQTRLLWAVTGAGKTEMLYEGIAYGLKNKKRIGIASPRIDVCLELAPRIKEAFPHTKIAVLYGGMEEKYGYTQLVIATTHQLYRFKEAFDVLIIDEVDAFPFHSNQSLFFAANKAKKKISSLIYLSATPTLVMQKQVKNKKLLSTILPARYHGHPLPVPKLKACWNWHEKLLKAPLRTPCGKKIQQLIKEERRFLIFIPNIEWMLKLEKKMRLVFPKCSFASVSAEDPERKAKVSAMRNKEFQFLMSSTILERGITFPNIDVLVIGAEDGIFTESALVQIAGRCGRAADYPTGEVIFYHDGKSIAMKRAVKQIKQMNKLAKTRGLIQ